MTLEVTQFLYGYWYKLKGSACAPERNAIDPGAIRSVLADAFILEYMPGAGFPLRVVGTRVAGLFQRNLRGAPFLDLWADGDRTEISDILETAADEARVCLLRAVGVAPPGDALELEILLLPLRHYGVARARLLGACTSARVPSWLGLASPGPLSLLSLTILGEADLNVKRKPEPPAFVLPGPSRRVAGGRF